MEKISVSDLSIGDWVNQKMNDGAYQVQWIEREMVGLIKHTGTEEDGSIRFIAVPLSSIEPIRLTPEILEKNGWSEFSDYHNSWKLDVASDKRVWMFKNSHDWTFQVMSWGLGHNHSAAKAYIKDIHELQHALRLAKVGKEIVL